MKLLLHRTLVTSLLVFSILLITVQGVEILDGPSDFIVIPPATEAVFSCNITEGGLPSWRINGSLFVRSAVFPAGHVLDGIYLNISMPANGSEYICVLIFLNGTAVETDPAFLFVADVPNVIPGVMVDLSSVSATPQFPAQPTQFSFTLNWGVPFANFDPILNYTINTSCSDNTVCPVTHVTGSDVTTLDISYTLPIITVNYTISVTANNTVGSSDPVMRIFAAPNQVQNVSVMCAPVDLDNECIVAWNDLAYGPNAVPLPILYLVSYSGINITANSSTVMSSPHVFTLPGVDGSVIVSVTAYNDFGSGGTSLGVQDTIMSPVVEATMSMLVEGDTPAETYSVEVECDISPSSTADYCEVIARNDDSTVSDSAAIMDNMATVTVNGLVCEQIYSIVAGGIITNDVMMDRTLDGPRFHTETITASACPVVITTTTMTTAAPTVTVTTTPTISSSPPGGGGGSDDSSIGAIIGGVVGGIVAVIVIIVIVIVVYFFSCKDRESGSRTMSPSGDKLPVTSAGAGAGRPTSVRVQTLDRYGKPMTDDSDGGNVELTDYKPVGSPEFTVNQMSSGNNQLTTKEESRTPSSYMPEGSYDTLAPADEPQGQSAPPTHNGQDQQQKGKLNYAELEQFSRKPASVKKPETQPPSQYAVIDPKSLQGTYT